MILLLPLLLIIHLLILSRLTFTAWPEMLSYPYLFSNGFTLYKDYVMPYPPGLVWLLSAVFNIFGFSPEVLKNFTWGLILTADLLMFIILRKITKSNLLALVFLTIFIVLQSFLEGNMLWFDFVMVIPLLLSFWFGLKDKFFFAGLFLALAILIKQTAGVYLLGFLIFVWGIRGIWVFGGGILTLMIPLLVYLVTTNSLNAFWNWTLLYPLTQWSKFPGYVDFSITPKYLLITLLLLAPIIGIVFSFKSLVKDRVFLINIIFLIAAIVAVYPRFSFFHLQPALAFTVILSAGIFFYLPKNIKVIYLSGILISSLIISALLYRSMVGDSIRFYSDNDKKLAQTVMNTTGGYESVYLLGLNSSEYVFVKKLPPRNWSDNFGWYLEIPGVQEWVIQGFEENPPKKVFWRIPNSGNWYDLGSYQPEKIAGYIKQNYYLTDKIEGGIEIWTRKN